MAGSSRLSRLLDGNELIRLFSNIPGIGRGLFAAQDIPLGRVIVEEVPIVSTAPVSKKESWCAGCLSPGSPLCVVCEKEQGVVLKGIDWGPLHAYCAEHGNQKFPLLASKLACMKIAGEDGHCEDVLHSLCHVNMDHNIIPQEWQDSYEALVESIPEARSHVSISWYVDVMSRIHPNAFRVDIIDAVPSMSLGGYSEHLKQFMARESGSAVYLLSSMFNHSCIPNVGVSFPKNTHEIRLTAERDIARHEHLCISYIDSNLPFAERQDLLEFSYGFRCECEKCQEEGPS